MQSDQHYTKYFDRLCFEASCKRPTLLSDFAIINNIALYNSLFLVEAIFQCDMQITKERE